MIRFMMLNNHCSKLRQLCHVLVSVSTFLLSEERIFGLNIGPVHTALHQRTYSPSHFTHLHTNQQVINGRWVKKWPVLKISN